MVVLLSATVASGQAAALSDAKLEKLKRATVFVRVQTIDGQSSGSGFVVHREGKAAFIATNAHVVGPTPVELNIIFNGGTSREKSLTAKLVSNSPTGDLAVLRVEGDELPEPLELKPAAPLKETTPVFIVGYPFGAQLNAKAPSPTVTVSRASVSSIERDDDDYITKLQFDGEVNPGNSGGPIVDVNGGVVAIARAKVSGTNISFAIPACALDADLKGRIANVEFENGRSDGKEALWGTRVTVVDPLDRLTKIVIVTAPKDSPEAPAIGTAGKFKRLPKSADHELQLQERVALGEVRVKLKKGQEAIWFQVKCTRTKGEALYTAASELSIPTGAGTAGGADGKSGKQTGGGAIPAVNEDYGQPEPLTAEKVTKLAAEVEDLCVAGGGRYLVLKLRATPALTVYDTYSASIAKAIRLPNAEFKFAAGGNTALVYLTEDNILQSWDLTTFEKRKTKPNPFSGPITNLAMGAGRSGLAVVRHCTSADQMAGCLHSCLNALTLEPLAPSGPPSPGMCSPHVAYRDRVHLSANSGLDALAEWGTSGSPSGVGYLRRIGTQIECKYAHDSAGGLLMGDDGRIYSSSGRIYSPKCESTAGVEGSSLHPAIGGTLYLALARDGKLSIFESGKTAALGPWGSFPEWVDPNAPGGASAGTGRGRGAPGAPVAPPGRPTQGQLPVHQRILFAPALGRAAFVGLSDDQIILRPFDLKAALDASGVDYLVVRSVPTASVNVGKEWSYQIEALSKSGGVTFELELAPEGMKVSKTGLVTWKPKTPPGKEGEKIIVLLKDKSGEQAYHTFTLTAGG